MRRTNIIVSLEQEGVHCWPECPIEEVDFLKNPHRHVFKIVCKKEVSHNDRDIEIIQLKRKIRYYLLSDYGVGHNGAEGCDFGRMSCEQIANELMSNFALNYCSVLEDGENGAEVFNQ